MKVNLELKSFADAQLKQLDGEPDKHLWLVMAGKFAIMTFDWKHLYRRYEFSYALQLAEQMQMTHWGTIKLPVI